MFELGAGVLLLEILDVPTCSGGSFELLAGLRRHDLLLLCVSAALLFVLIVVVLIVVLIRDRERRNTKTTGNC